jgi:hypothetical protein
MQPVCAERATALHNRPPRRRCVFGNARDPTVPLFFFAGVGRLCLDVCVCLCKKVVRAFYFLLLQQGRDEIGCSLAPCAPLMN